MCENKNKWYCCVFIYICLFLKEISAVCIFLNVNEVLVAVWQNIKYIQAVKVKMSQK